MGLVDGILPRLSSKWIELKEGRHGALAASDCGVRSAFGARSTSTSLCNDPVIFEGVFGAA